MIQFLLEEALLFRVEYEQQQAEEYRAAELDAHRKAQAELARVAGGVR